MDNIVNKLPKDISLSVHLKENSLAYFKIKLYGVDYYIPLTKKMKKVLHIKKRGKDWIIPNELKVYDTIQHIVDSLYLQVRDTVGAEIHSSLSQELEKGFNNIFSKILEKKIDNKFKKLLPHKKD